VISSGRLVAAARAGRLAAGAKSAMQNKKIQSMGRTGDFSSSKLAGGAL
jgi:hypothetical protein